MYVLPLRLLLVLAPAQNYDMIYVNTPLRLACLYQHTYCRQHASTNL